MAGHRQRSQSGSVHSGSVMLRAVGTPPPLGTLRPAKVRCLPASLPKNGTKLGLLDPRSHPKAGRKEPSGQAGAGGFSVCGTCGNQAVFAERTPPVVLQGEGRTSRGVLNLALGKCVVGLAQGGWGGEGPRAKPGT